jgi:FMN phosphatase YigB (HAD superfamily)
LIIFDLDDTLIDTSGSVTPFKMRSCLNRLKETGLRIPDFEKAYEELLAINARSSKSKEAIERFAFPYQLTKAQIAAAVEELTTPLPKDFSIPTTPFAKEILKYFRSLCPLALVTGGHPPFQKDKLKKAGIEVSVFSMIAIPEDSVKKPYYEALQRKFSVPPQDVWVCGDRVSMDLKPARELGYRTVHMRWGRGKMSATEDWIDYSISELRELKEIVR